MTDELSPPIQPQAPPPLIVEMASQNPIWKGSVAAKKVGWALSKILAAKIVGWMSLPSIMSAWGSFCGVLQAHGVIIIIDQKVFATALPGIIFGGLVTAHDLAKVKLGYRWL